MTEPKIRSATPADVAEIHAMIRELGAHQGEGEHVRITAEGLAARLFGADPQASVLVAEDGGRLVGFASWMVRFSIWHDAPFVCLDDVYVREAARGRGVGRLLMEGLARIALDRGMNVRWEAKADNNRALAFYRALGAGVRTKVVCWWEAEAMRAALAGPVDRAAG